ncbi:MAG: type I pullulanase [Phycisphaerae bacterium]|nr:type I pullulanase [Phycisphaerae bacterium]
MVSLRWLLALAFAGIVAISPTAAWASPQRAVDAPRIARTLDPERLGAEAILVVHYHRPDGKYANWNLWSWPEHGDGAAFAFEQSDVFGRYAIVPFPKLAPRAGFIVRRGEWEEKDFDQDRFVELRAGEVTEVWIVSGDDRVRSDPGEIDLSLRVVGAFLDARDRITLATTVPLSERQRKGISVRVKGSDTALVVGTTEPAAPSGGKSILDITLAKPVAPADVGRLSLAFEERLFDDLPTQVVYARDVLDGAEFAALDDPLGPRCEATGTWFSTWSPVAESVDLILWKSAGSTVAIAVPMMRGERGTWATHVSGDLHGLAYRYRFTCYGVTSEVPDMHCLAATSDSSRSVVVDMDRLKPDAWHSVASPPRAHPTDEIAYEIHVRDFSIRDAACPEEDRGRYRGLSRGRGRTNASDGVRPSTGIRHLQELGVTAVHLLPVHDFTAKRDEYNWGYWTTLFNVPESNYASDPNDPTAPIVELREAIADLHRAGLRVILDVVYNHTSDAGPNSPFGAAVPNYFFRTTRDGRLVNDTGVGNTIADERPMMRKFIVDSLRHWVRNYRVDGFRFDLLGSNDPATVKAICDALLKDRHDLTLYGEPWTGGGTVRFGKGAQKGLPIAVFNDHLRNAIRGDLDGATVGFATGVGGDVAAIRRGVMGAIDDFAQEPGESVAYASAHDNLTLWDKIVKTQPAASDAERRAMQKLALGIVLTSQGVAFLHGGCDFCRTKEGQHNTYVAGDEINRFDWKRKAEYIEVFDYVAGLVKLRREHPVFRMADDTDVRRSMTFLEAGRTMAFTLDGAIARDTWERILVVYNDEPTALEFSLPTAGGEGDGEWTIVVNHERAGNEPLAVARGRVTLPGYSLLVAHAKR